MPALGERVLAANNNFLIAPSIGECFELVYSSSRFRLHHLNRRPILSVCSDSRFSSTEKLEKRKSKQEARLAPKLGTDASARNEVVDNYSRIS